mgnify:CR=1 FL=1
MIIGPALIFILLLGVPVGVAFTLVVMMLSSTYSPVPSCFEVAAQPTAPASATARKAADRYRLMSCMKNSFENQYSSA